MSTLWHFGSMRSTDKYGKGLSELLNLSYNHQIIPNPTNQSIFTKILENTPLYQKNDILLINWVDFRLNDIVIKKNNKAVTRNIQNVNDWELQNNYFAYKSEYKKHFYKESFLLFDMILKYCESLHSFGTKIYFVYDTIRNFLIPPKFDLLHQLSNNIKDTSFLDFLYKGGHIDVYSNSIKDESVDEINEFLTTCMFNYQFNNSESFDNSTFPKSRYTLGRDNNKQHNTTTDHSTQVDNPPTKIF